jgi:hypothetical protein
MVSRFLRTKAPGWNVKAPSFAHQSDAIDIPPAGQGIMGGVGCVDLGFVCLAVSRFSNLVCAHHCALACSM